MITDEDIGGGVTIECEHHMIHAGKSFQGSFTTTAGANTTGAVMVIRTGTTDGEPRNHIGFQVSATGAGTVEMYESTGTNTTGAGTTVPLYNLKRTSANTTQTRIYSMTSGNAFSSAVSRGTLVSLSLLGSSGRDAFGGGSSGSRGELILKSATTYLLAFNNANGAATTNCCYYVYFYQQSVAG